MSSETSGSATVFDVEASRTARKQGLTQFITNIFSSAKIQESFEDRIIFSIAQENVTSLAEMFKSLEEGNNLLFCLSTSLIKRIQISLVMKLWRTIDKYAVASIYQVYS